MKSIFVAIIFFLFANILLYAQPALHKLWQTDTVLSVPESVLLIKEDRQLYVSLIGAGNASAEDENGSIAKLDDKGNILDKAWATGLSSPKGMAKYKNKLYVADLNAVVVIDFKSGKIINKIVIPDAGMLNDVSLSQQGSIFVSDSKGGKIYEIVNDQATVYLENLVNPNGVLAAQDILYFLDSGTLYQADRKKKITKIADGMEKSTDGIQLDGEHFIISCWIGIMYYVSKDGKKATLLDTRAEKTNTADFDFDHQTRTIYLPTFFKNHVVAYRLEQSN